MKKILFSALSMLLICWCANAQNVPLDTSVNYGIAALVKDHSVILRWAPRSYAVWRLANKNGYILERAEAPEQTTDLRKLAYQRVQANPFKPYTLAEWKSRTDTTNIAVGTAAQVLYGQTQAGKSGTDGFGLLHEQGNEQALRHSFALHAAELNAQAAEGLALRFEDRSLDKTKEYVYRIFNLPSTKGFKTDTAYVLVYPAFPRAPQKVLSPFVEEGDHMLKVMWSRNANRSLFTAFFVEKSADKGQTFQRLNQHPLVFNFNDNEAEDFNYIDSSIVNGREYQYRIIGITSFAEEGLPSDVVKGMGKDLNAPIPPTQLWVKDIGNKFEITWSVDHLSFPDHAGFVVGRSMSANGPFAPLMEKPLTKETRRFVDENPVPMMSNYYVVFALDDKNNFNMSPVVSGIHHDAEPPAAPVGLRGVCDTTGLITLTWEASKEPDLLGYRVFMATSQNREWFQITSSELPMEPTFQQQVALNSLTEKVYFTVVAMDFHFNASAYATTAEVILPDTIAPEKPLILDYSANPDNIKLRWAKSGSPDAVKTHLLRRSDGQEWALLADVSAYKSSNYTDTSARPGVRYEYALETFDDAGISSGKTRPLQVVGADQGARPGVDKLQGLYDKSQKQFSISWDYIPKGRYNFGIYRAVTGQAPELIGQVAGTERRFEDLSLVSQKEGYEYFVKVIWADGGESEFSKPLAVRFTPGK